MAIQVDSLAKLEAAMFDEMKLNTVCTCYLTESILSVGLKFQLIWYELGAKKLES